MVDRRENLRFRRSALIQNNFASEMIVESLNTDNLVVIILASVSGLDLLRRALIWAAPKADYAQALILPALVSFLWFGRTENAPFVERPQRSCLRHGICDH